MSFAEWIQAAESDKNGIDVDLAFGNQCVDVWLSWITYLYPQFPRSELTGPGNAKDLFAAANPKYFEKIPYRNGFIPGQGDGVIWGPTASNPFGHVAVVIMADGKGVNVLEQNGFNPSGVAYRATRPYLNVIGYLRPQVLKGDDMPVDGKTAAQWKEFWLQDIGLERAQSRLNSGDVTNLTRALYGKEPTEAELSFVGKQWKELVYAMLSNKAFKERVK
jgi:hypothetical protein